MSSEQIKLISQGPKRKYIIRAELDKQDDMLVLSFPYDEYLKDEVKASMEGAKWNPDLSAWTFRDVRRNHFQLAYLKGEKPYAWYDQPLKEFESRIPTLMPQQQHMVQQAITFRQVIWAAEMGLGKTLAAILAIEWAHKNLGFTRCWWIAPKSALASFELEVDHWGMELYPEKVMTFEGLVKLMSKWDGGDAPEIAIIDESSRVKNLSAKRTQAVLHLVEGMREDLGSNNPMIIEMTGTPAPKSPLDWYSQCEIAKPGFLREGNIHKFRDRLGVTIQKQNQTTGGIYPEHVTWRDDELKCKHCGALRVDHDFEVMQRGTEPHNWERGTNEVAKLYKRMDGLVSVYFKKDWLKHLPDKNFRILRCPVSRQMQQVANSIRDASPTAIMALTLLRELSDGFQYEASEIGYARCPTCKGIRKVEVPIVDEIDDLEFSFNPETATPIRLEWVECSHCNGTGEIPRYGRTVNKVACPKDDLLEEILDDHEDGRLVVYGGFTGSIDRIVEVFKRKGWEYIRVDGGTWQSSLVDTEGRAVSEAPVLLKAFQQGQNKFPKLGFVGHPASAGMGLTLTASCEIVYYSNTFNAEDRIQSMDRIHRPGMDVNKGAIITDLVHLETDLLILDNLNKKKRLQDMSLGQFHESLKMIGERN